MRFLALGLLFGLFAGCGVSGADTKDIGTGGSFSTITATNTTTSITTGAGGAATSSSSSSSGGGMDGGTFTTSTTQTLPTKHGDCATDADCPGGACVHITPGGFRVCQTPPEVAMDCVSGLDQCCPGTPCPDNAPCYAGPLVPYCGGIPPETENQCAVDQCTQDADCAPGQICGIAGALGRKVRACAAAGCKVDADCDASSGGVCAPIADPCCGTFAGLFCVYPGNGCRSNADCDGSSFCQISGSSATCQSGSPVCPG
jgi:hypothetical protein